MPPKNLICVVVDRLHAGMLGAYGNSWIHSAQFDRLACESFLFDQALIDCPELAQIYRGYWLGAPAVGKSSQVPATASLIQLLNAAGWHTVLMTDEREVAGHVLANDFAQRIFVEPSATDATASAVEETQMARLFGTTTEHLATIEQPFCLWLHVRGMAGAWDAPLEFRNQYADEEDPVPPDFTTVPDRWLPDEYDPDELLGITHAYAGQISLLDLCLGALLDYLQEAELDANTQLTLLGARGFPLGEHRRVGTCDYALYNELIQTPWLMRFPADLGKLARSQALVQPADLPGTLLDWLGLDRSQLGAGHASSLLPIIGDLAESIRDHIGLISRHERAIRTSAWLLREPETGAAELYAKPSDRWEVNEVANLLPEVVVGLQAARVEMEQADEASKNLPLAQPLVTEFD